MTRRWDVALDELLTFYSLWMTPEGEEYSQRVIRDLEYEKVFKDFHSRFAAHLLRADPIYVDDDMMTLLETAGSQFKPEPLVETDLITTFGFVHLPRPLHFVVHGDDGIREIVPYRYITWGLERHIYKDGTTLPVLIITVWKHPKDKVEWVNFQKFIEITHYPQIIAIVPWPADGKTLYTDAPTGQWYQIAPYVQALLRLMAQTITIKSKETPTRPLRRRLEKADYPTRPITVITLRRPRNDNPDHEKRDVAWTHRWLVSGHWRNQWFSSLNIHRQIWISPFIKGPEDKPLEIRKARVFELVR